MKTSRVFVVSVVCSVLVSAYLFDHSPTPVLVQSASLVSVLLFMLSCLITYAVYVYRKYDAPIYAQRRREQLLSQHYPHVAEFNRRTGALHKRSASSKL